MTSRESSVASLRAGAARVVITPPVGTPLAGYFAPRKSTGIHDDLHAHALVLDDGATKVAIVSCDLISVRRTLVTKIREQVEAETGIPAGNVLICATHIHTGPYTSRLLGGGLDTALDAILPRYIAGAVAAASNRLGDAVLASGTASVEGVSFNRRFRMRNGRTSTNPGIGNPAIIEPAGPIDPALGVIRVSRPDGSLAAVIVNFTLHSDVVGGSEFSADWAGVLGSCLRRQYGDDVVVLVMNGACGDINHINVRGERLQGGFEYAAWIGRVLAGETMRVLEQCTPETEAALACASETLTIPIREVTPEQLAWARSVVEGAEGRAVKSKEAFLADEMGASDYVEECYAREALAISEAFPTEPEIPVEVQAMRIGRVGIIANPAELFVEPGLAIKAGSPLQPAFVVGYANGMCGYVPTARAFGEGGYEPRLARSSRLVPEAAEQIVAASLRVLMRVE